MISRIELFNSPICWPPKQDCANETATPKKWTHIPLGLLCLATSLRESGIDVRVHDLWSFPQDEGSLLGLLSDTDAILFGLNVCSPTLDVAWRFAKFLKLNWPDTAIVAGGAHASAWPSSLISQDSPFDFVISGEGEEALLHLVQYLSDAHRDMRGPGKLVIASQGISSLVRNHCPDLSFLEMGKYLSARREIPIVTSRGCEFLCGYCAISQIYGTQVHHKPALNIIKEVERYRRDYKCDQFKFISENFISRDKNAFLNTLSTLHDISPAIRWRCQLRVDNLSVSDIQSLAHSGCCGVLFGVDTVSERSQHLAGRKVDLGHIANIAESLCEMGIKTQAVFIIGFPNETLTEMTDTIRFAIALRRLGADEITFFPLMLFPGTPLWHAYGEKMLFGALPITRSSLPDLMASESYFENYSLIPEPVSPADNERIAMVMSVIRYAYQAIETQSDISVNDLALYLRDHRQAWQIFSELAWSLKQQAYLGMQRDGFSA
jgi:anaerobic magnesium-protoporphyrin IX monomethyl ester cyclase